MGAAWEWRGFRPFGGAVPFTDLAATIAAKVGLDPPGPAVPELDQYLVLRGLCHNLKLRRGALEIKRLVLRRRSGFSLWEDKVVINFPMTENQISDLWALLPGSLSPPPSELASAAALVEALRPLHPELHVIQVAKQRVRMDNGQARLELADLRLPGATRWLSFCADGYDLSEVRKVIYRSQVRAGTRSMSYVDWLQQALSWFPNLTREVMVQDGACTS